MIRVGHRQHGYSENFDFSSIKNFLNPSIKNHSHAPVRYISIEITKNPNCSKFLMRHLELQTWKKGRTDKRTDTRMDRREGWNSNLDCHPKDGPFLWVIFVHIWKVFLKKILYPNERKMFFRNSFTKKENKVFWKLIFIDLALFPT